MTREEYLDYINEGVREFREYQAKRGEERELSVASD
jgi:hypothetical protein